MMQNKYILWNKIDNFLGANDFFNNKIAKRVLAVILKIDIQAIKFLNVRNRCINVFTDKYLYKIALYGGTIGKDLTNRKLFSVCGRSVLSPVKVYKRIPLIIMMPILKHPIKNEEAACYILDKLTRCAS